MDQYASIRSLSFPTLCQALGIDFTPFKRDNRKHEYVGPCPIHGSKDNKSCFRYNDSGVFHCFSQNCKGSGAIDLVKAVKRIGFTEAVAFLGGVEVTPQVQSLATGQDLKPSKPIDSSSYRKHAVWPCPWLEARGITKETADKFGVFLYDNPSRKSAYKGRVLIPFTNFETGKVDGYMGRYTGTDTAQSKYLVPSGFPKSEYLFGAAELKDQGKLKIVFLVESPFCVLRFHQLGFSAVACYGWSLSENQVSILKLVARGVVFLPDSNKYQDALPAIGSISKAMWVRYPEILEAIDPEYLDQNQIR